MKDISMKQDDMRAAAQAFVEHRRLAKAFAQFPSPLPTTLDAAYAIQNEAIALWRKPIAGWKVGRITGQAENDLGENRFVGPIFADGIWSISGPDVAPFPAIRNGFAAVEAELIAVVRNVEQSGEISAPDCLPLISDWHIGIEVAGSPLSSINDLGPLASIAGFGNNIGLLLGPRVQLPDPAALSCTTSIDGDLKGPHTAAALPGGPLAAVAFALNRLHKLGHAVPDGTLISTGAVTGVHPVIPGQKCEVRFDRYPPILCEVTAI
jgi:2-keto-4-pentenoate hydratase